MYRGTADTRLSTAMVRMIVKECCCGCSLRTGTLAIAVYNTVEGILGIAIYFTVAFSDDSDYQRRNIYIISAVICIVEMIASICLLHGAMKEKKSFITPWLVTNAVLLVSYLVIININLFLVVAAGNSIAFSLSGFVSVALMIYFLIVVYSYRESLLHRGSASGGGGHVITYTVEDPGVVHQPVVLAQPLDVAYPQYPPGYPHQMHGFHDYPRQPPPYDNPGAYLAGSAPPFHQPHEQKLQP